MSNFGKTELLGIIQNDALKGVVNAVAQQLGVTPEVLVGRPSDAANSLRSRVSGPRYIIIDAGDSAHELLSDIDELAEYCEAHTRVVVLGTTNDITFYRALLQRGVIEYFVHPANPEDVSRALRVQVQQEVAGNTSGEAHVIPFVSAASGDGASTAALNTAYCLAVRLQRPTVLVDMDYQFGMVAKNLDLASPFGLKEIIEHPERKIDSTLMNRMVVKYAENLHIVSAPNELRLIPDIQPQLITEIVDTLKSQFEYIIIDLPHLWTPWVMAILNQASSITLVAQLWLRSVTHASRLISAWSEAGISRDKLSVVINRSGARYKEAISERDFERVCEAAIDFRLINDIKAIVSAENQGRTIIESGNSKLAKQLLEYAQYLDGKFTDDSTAGDNKTDDLSKRLLFNRS